MSEFKAHVFKPWEGAGEFEFTFGDSSMCKFTLKRHLLAISPGGLGFASEVPPAVKEVLVCGRCCLSRVFDSSAASQLVVADAACADVADSLVASDGAVQVEAHVGCGSSSVDVVISKAGLCPGFIVVEVGLHRDASCQFPALLCRHGYRLHMSPWCLQCNVSLHIRS